MTVRATDIIKFTNNKHLDYEIRISYKDVEYIKREPLKSKRCKFSYFRGIMDFKVCGGRKCLTLRDFKKLCKDKNISDLDYLVTYNEKEKQVISFKSVIIDNSNKFIILI